MSFFQSGDMEAMSRYNGMDCIATLELMDEIPQSNFSRTTYDFERALQAPLLEMMLRGIKVDEMKIEGVKARLRPELETHVKALAYIGKELVGYPVNPFSTGQVQHLLHGEIGYPAQFKLAKGKRIASSGKQQLKDLSDKFPEAHLITRHVLGARDIAKQIQFLETGVDADGRIRTSYNIAGTETGRLSSSTNAFGTGGNLLNVNERMRKIFVADPGYILASFDGAQAEARIVAMLIYRASGMLEYLNAIEGFDLHTAVAMKAWPGMPWPSDPALRIKFAKDTMFTLIDPIRQVAKKLAHGTNYLATAAGIARTLGLDRKTVEDFQRDYLTGFGFTHWHSGVAIQLQTVRHLDTMYGRRRWFHGRQWDDATLREAIAYEPQSTIGDHFLLGLLRIWLGDLAILLNNGYDSLLVQVPVDSDTHDRLETVRRTLEQPLTVEYEGKPLTHTIPIDCEIGYNWGKFDPKKPLMNPRGLRAWEKGMSLDF